MIAAQTQATIAAAGDSVTWIRTVTPQAILSLTDIYKARKVNADTRAVETFQKDRDYIEARRMFLKDEADSDKRHTSDNSCAWYELQVGEARAWSDFMDITKSAFGGIPQYDLSPAYVAQKVILDRDYKHGLAGYAFDREMARVKHLTVWASFRVNA